MRKPIATTTLGAVSVLIFAAMVHADEIRVLSTQATEEAYRELVPQFEKASGHKVTTVFTGTLDANKRLAAGESYDLLIMSAQSIDQHIKADKVVPGSRVDLAKSGIGVGVKAGAPKRVEQRGHRCIPRASPRSETKRPAPAACRCRPRIRARDAQTSARRRPRSSR